MLESKNTSAPDDKRTFEHGELSLVNLVAAMQEHAKGSHDYEVSREHVLVELGVAAGA